MTKIDITQKQKQLLDAAGQIVRKKGPGGLTLAAVAQEAAVSKGGLLHYFPNKDALIEGMVAQLIAAFETAVTHKTSQSDKPTAWLSAYIQTTFDLKLSQAEESAGVLAAVANNPTLLNPLRERYQEWQEQIKNSGIDSVLATVLCLAADGLWFGELLELHDLGHEERAAVLEMIMSIIDNA